LARERRLETGRIERYGATHLPMNGRRRAGLALLGAWFLFFGPQLFSATVTFYRDHLLTYLPLEQFIRGRLLRGELPQWYPYEALGVPLVGQIATGLFHPLTYLLLPFPAVLAVKLKLLLAYLWAEWAAYRVCRGARCSRPASLAGAFAFAFGGYLLGVSSTSPYVLSAAALASALWATQRLVLRARLKDVALLALFLALIFLAGDPQSLLLFMPVALGVWAFKPRARSLALLGLSGGLGLLLCGVELWPARACFAQSVRMLGQVSAEIDTFWALQPWRLPELVIPGYIPDAVRETMVRHFLGGTEQTFVTTLFAGGTVFLAGLAAWAAPKRRLALACWGAALFGLWMALGAHGGLTPLLRQAVPFLQRFRYPEKMMVFFWLGLFPAVALGMDELAAAPRRWAGAAAGFAAAMGLLAIIARYGLAHHLWVLAGNGPVPDAGTLGLVGHAWSGGLLWTAMSLLLLAVLLAALPGQNRLVWLLPAVVFIELWHGNGAHLPVVPATFLSVSNPMAGEILRRAPPPEEGPLPRVFSEAYSRQDTVTGDHEAWVAETLRALPPDTAALYGIDSLLPRLGGFSMRYARFIGAAGENGNRFGPLVHACYRVSNVGQPAGVGEEVLGQLGDLRLGIRPCMPRAFVSGAVPVRDWREAAHQLGHAVLPLSSVPWEGGPYLPPSVGHVRWLRNEPEHLMLEVETSAPAALVVGDEYAPGWSARVDGVPTPIYPTLIDVRGVAVSPGTHRVEMTYETPGLRLGLASSLLGIAICAALLAITRRWTSQ
jgi:hypothetical protein